MPDDVVQDLIAHELAHVMQRQEGVVCVKEYSDGRADWVDRDGNWWGGNFEIEWDADERMVIWGFDPESIDRWSLATGRKKVIQLEGPEGRAKVFARLERHGR